MTKNIKTVYKRYYQIGEKIIMKQIKKYISFFLSLSLIVFMLLGCSKNDGNKVKEGECNHVWLEADCENPKKCKKCGETEGEALGHTTDFGVCDRCEKMVNEELLYEIKEAADYLDDSVNSIYEELNKINYVTLENAYEGIKGADQYLPRVNESIDRYITVCEKSSKLEALKNNLYSLKESVPDELNSHGLMEMVTSLESYKAFYERLEDVLLELNSVLEGLQG